MNSLIVVGRSVPCRAVFELQPNQPLNRTQHVPATDSLHPARLIDLPPAGVTSPVGPVSSVRWAAGAGQNLARAFGPDVSTGPLSRVGSKIDYRNHRQWHPNLGHVLGLTRATATRSLPPPGPPQRSSMNAVLNARLRPPLERSTVRSSPAGPTKSLNRTPQVPAIKALSTFRLHAADSARLPRRWGRLVPVR